MMKKFLFAAFCLAGILSARAQSTPHALGLHIGASTIDLEYQYHVSNSRFWDFTAGVFNVEDGMCLSGVHNWHIVSWPHWTPELGTWKMWGGVGAATGYTTYHDYDGVFAGVVGNIAFGLTLKAPWTFSIDYRPVVALAVGDRTGFINPGIWNLGLSAVYRF